VTLFEPLALGRGFTLARVTTETGRKHQIRAHAQWLGHSIVGDKIYGPDARLYLDFIDDGWTAAAGGEAPPPAPGAPLLSRST
jgi:23S rRNA pseudouridine1911/1915/1917 synthase